MHAMFPALSLALGLLAPAGAASAPLPTVGSGQPRALTLEEAVALALRSDPQVAQAQVARDRSKLAVLRAQLDRLSLKVDGSLQEEWTDSNIGGPKGCTAAATSDPVACAAAGGVLVQDTQAGLGLLNLSANLTVPLFSGFRVEANVGQAEKLDQSAIAEIRRQRRDTALAVARAYWNVRRLGLLAEVLAASVDRLREAEAIAAVRVKSGLAPPIDRNRAISRRLQQEATVVDLQGQAHEASVQLAVALGLHEEIALTDSPGFPEAPPGPVQTLLDQAHGARPELKSGQFQLVAQAETVRKAVAGYYPQLSAFGLAQFGNNPFITGYGASVTSTTSANPLTNTSANLQLGLVLSVNLFDTFNTVTAVRDARYEQVRLAEELRRLDRLVEADVRLAHARLGHLYRQRAPLVEARGVAQDNLDILERRYKNGDALIIELLDAQIDLASVDQQLADVTARLQLAWLELDASLGKVVGGET